MMTWVYVHSTICTTNDFGVVVHLHIWCSGFQRSMLNLEEGVGSVCHGYMCILLFMKLIWHSGFPEIYAQLEQGVGSVCYDD